MVNITEDEKIEVEEVEAAENNNDIPPMSACDGDVEKEVTSAIDLSSSKRVATVKVKDSTGMNLWRNRIESFYHPNWTKKFLNIYKIADAGFFYTGTKDCTICCHCGLKVENWNLTDDPWQEHAFWYPSCDHVTWNMGSEYIRSVQENWLQHMEKPENLKF
jgi:hypothetical protein